jgi:2'-5' RNA ligase
MKRTFIAIDIIPSSTLTEAYELIRYRMRLERINWVPVGNLHITLSFLGDTAEDGIPEITRAMQLAVKDRSAFNLTLHSLGIFKNLNDPRVLWLGCDYDETMVLIKKELDAQLEPLGFKGEKRTFAPHLTLGRIKSLRQQNQLIQLITQFKDTVFQTQKISSIVFYESRLTSSGPDYIPLQEIKFPSS